MSKQKYGTGKIRPFSMAYDAIPGGMLSVVRNEILVKCKWSDELFYKKKNGQRSISDEDAKTVEKIFRKHGVDACTGTPLESVAQ